MTNTTTTKTTIANIVEQGNGYPDVGDYVQTADAIYRVVAIGNNIQTGGPGNSLSAELAEADWDDCDDDAVVSCRVDLT